MSDTKPWIVYEGRTGHQHRLAHLPRLASQYPVPTADFCVRFACGATGNRARVGYYSELPAAVVGLAVRPCGPCQVRYGRSRVKPAAERECVQLRAERDQALALLRDIRIEFGDRHFATMGAARRRLLDLIDALLDDEGQQR